MAIHRVVGVGNRLPHRSSGAKEFEQCANGVKHSLWVTWRRKSKEVAGGQGK